MILLVMNFVSSSAQYCLPSPSTVANEGIVRVQLNTLDSSTPAEEGYIDYTGISTTLKQGETYTLTVTFSSPGSRIASVFVDWDQDESFAGTPYYLFTLGSDSKSMLVTVPLDAVIGTTRMRVSGRTMAPPVNMACDNLPNADVEDYTILVDAPTGIEVEMGLLSGVKLKYRNHVQELIAFFPASNGQSAFQVYNLVGQVLSSWKVQGSSTDEINQTTINTANLASGIYILNMNQEGRRTQKKFVLE